MAIDSQIFAVEGLSFVSLLGVAGKPVGWNTWWTERPKVFIYFQRSI